MIHIDTTFAIDLLRERRRRSPGPAHAWLAAHDDEELSVCLHVRCELAVGARRSTRPESVTELKHFLAALTHVEVAPDLPERYGELMKELLARGERISSIDALIAAQALSDGATVLTRNVREFARVPGLRVETY